MSADLALHEILPAGWLKVLEPVILKQPAGDLTRFLLKSRPWTIPARENTFAALRGRNNPHDWNVVILGQDPYPREESAVGVAFNDGAIKKVSLKWTDKLNPSFTNIMKSVMIHEKKLSNGADIAEFRKAAKSSNLVDPPEWFNHTQREGVMWLNTALTFSSTDIPVLKEHTDFWRPIVTAIFENLINSKKEELKKNPGAKQGLVIIMWGGYAQKYRKIIEELNGKSAPALQISFVENNHPAATGPALAAFHQNNSFTKANEALKGFGLPEVKWFSDTPGPAQAKSGESSSASALAKTSKATSSSTLQPAETKAAPEKKRKGAETTGEGEAAEDTKTKKSKTAKSK